MSEKHPTIFWKNMHILQAKELLKEVGEYIRYSSYSSAATIIRDRIQFYLDHPGDRTEEEWDTLFKSVRLDLKILGQLASIDKQLLKAEGK